jgi:transcriptional regulator with XRE-family HTH domain
MESMRIRKIETGNSNLVGQRVETRRKEMGMKQKDLLERLQLQGIDLNVSGLSKIEGKLRKVTDIELLAFSRVLDVSPLWLLGMEEE